MAATMWEATAGLMHTLMSPNRRYHRALAYKYWVEAHNDAWYGDPELARFHEQYSWWNLLLAEAEG